MGSLSNFGENAWMGHLFGSAYSHVATLYLALATADPGETATGASMNEVADANNYARKAITFAAADSRKVVQTGAVTFNQASGAWGVVTHWAIVDSGTHGAGNVLAYGAFSDSFSPVSGNTPSIASGQVQVEISASSGEGFVTQLVHWMLNFMFRNVDYAQPATYIALLHLAGEDADTVLNADEVTGTDYARVLVKKAAAGSPEWNDVSGGTVDNEHEIVFPTVGAGGWSKLVGIAIVDSATLTEGNVLAFDNDQVVDQTPAAGDTVKFAAGALDVALT